MQRVWASVAWVVVWLLATPAHTQELLKDSKGREFVVSEDGVCTPKPTKPRSGGFRGATWGMSIPEVKKIEGITPTAETDSGLFYADQSVANIPATVHYSFINGSLASGAYIATQQHTHRPQHISEYKTVEALLTAKYGAPSRSKTVWHDSTFKHQPDQWGTALALGHLTMGSQWTADDTEISMLLSGGDFKVTLTVLYTHLPAKAADEDMRRRAKMKGL